MASISKRGSKWRCQINTPRGRRSKTFVTKRQAQEWAAQFYFNACCTVTFAEVARGYLRDVSEYKKDYRTDYLRLKRILNQRFTKLRIDQITPADLACMIGHRDIKNLMIHYNATASEIAARLAL